MYVASEKKASSSTPLGGVKPSKSAPHMHVRSYLMGLDIRSIDTHQEASDELSRSPVGDDVRSGSIYQCVCSIPP